ADARDPDGRALEDRAVVGLAALQRDRRLRAVDELADLGTGHREHGHDLAVYVWPSSSEQHQETADGAPDCDGACHLDSQPRAASPISDSLAADTSSFTAGTPDRMALPIRPLFVCSAMW